MSTEKTEGAAPAAEPTAWLWQHKETGRTRVVMPDQIITTDAADVRAAAQALVDRWDTPAWKDAEHTGAFIQRLRKALAAPPAPEVRAPLSIEEVEAILARWDYAIHGDRVRYIVRETERAHGIRAKEPTP